MTDRTVCVFGTGKIGTGKGLQTLRLLNINVDFYCDNDRDKWGKTICDDIKCIPPATLCALKNVTCYVMMKTEYCDEVLKQLERLEIKDIIRWEEIQYCDQVVDNFYMKIPLASKLCTRRTTPPPSNIVPVHNVKSKQIAIYTCITGNYDKFIEPCCFDNAVFDYYLISDNKPNDLSVFQWIDSKTVIPDEIRNHARRNRYVKILGNELFSEYCYSVYIDGNMCIIRDVSKFVQKIGKYGIALYTHSSNKDCIYAEGMDCIEQKKDSADVIYNQMQKYRREGLPKHYGLFACGLIVRENNNPMVKTIMREWWREVYMYSYRDQLSFTYVLWKNGIQAKHIGFLGCDIYKSQYIKFLSYHS